MSLKGNIILPLKINHNLYSYSDKPAFKGDKNEIQHAHPYNPQVQNKDAFKLQSKDAQNKQGFFSKVLSKMKAFFDKKETVVSNKIAGCVEEANNFPEPEQVIDVKEIIKPTSSEPLGLEAGEAILKEVLDGKSYDDVIFEKTIQDVPFHQACFEIDNACASKIVSKYMDNLDEILLNSDGAIRENCMINGGAAYTFDELFEPYDGELGKIYHGTSVENKAKILKQGFIQTISPVNGCLDGIGGTYFSLENLDKYGKAVITATFEGKVAKTDTDLLDRIKIGNLPLLEEFLKNIKLEEECSAETVMRKYLTEKLFKMGYQGILGKNNSAAAGCKYFAALSPDLIKIIS